MSEVCLGEGCIIRDPGAGGIGQRDFKIGALLGKGGFATCYELTSIHSSRKFACKVVAKASLTNTMTKTKLINEIKLHRNLSHKNIVKFYHFFEDESNVYILLELCRHQSLVEMVKQRGRLTQPEVQFFMLQLLDGLEYLHGQGVIHRDLKLGNLFLADELVVKVGDFGLATRLEFDDQRKRTLCGTPNFIAPEILNNGVGGHGLEVDIWSLGVIMYALLVGKPPYETSDIKKTYSRIRSNTYEYPAETPISAQAKDLISRMLVLLPERRASLLEIRRHSFFKMNVPPSSLPLSALAMDPFRQPLACRNHNVLPVTIKNKAKRSPETAKASYPGENEGVAVTETSPMILDHRQVCEAIERSFAARSRKKVAHANAQPSWPRPRVYITNFLDYSRKYGVGYLLSDGCIGVYFNDGSKVILDPTATFFHYYERRSMHKQVMQLKAYPKEMTKKATLLQHFRKSLLPDQSTRPASSTELVYVRKWTASKSAVLFSLSDKSIQVRFADKADLVISEKRVVAYTDPLGATNTYHLDHVSSDSTPAHLLRRLQYTKAVLSHISRSSVS